MCFDLTGSPAASTLVSLAVRLTVTSCIFFLVFFCHFFRVRGRLQQSFPGFVTTERQLISFGILILTENVGEMDAQEFEIEFTMIQLVCKVINKQLFIQNILCAL